MEEGEKQPWWWGVLQVKDFIISGGEKLIRGRKVRGGGGQSESKKKKKRSESCCFPAESVWGLADVEDV